MDIFSQKNIKSVSSIVDVAMYGPPLNEADKKKMAKSGFNPMDMMTMMSP